jgi:hypothetical protein
MFPPWIHLPAGIAHFSAIYFAAQILAGATELVVTWSALVGAASVVLFTLLMRVYDELKDVETDLRLGLAGDPRYVDRAVVQGRVLPGDLVALRWYTTGALVGLNLFFGVSLPGVAFVVTFFLMWLSFKWFFWPEMSRYLLAAFVTHNPLALAVVAYIVSVFVYDFGPGSLIFPAAALLAVGYWTAVAAWETGRKIRPPESETEYQTYSKVLGWRVAAWIPACFFAVSAGSLLSIVARTGAGWWVAGLLVATAGLGILACLRFRLFPSDHSARLQPFAELYALAANVGLAAALVVRYGLSWG